MAILLVGWVTLGALAAPVVGAHLARQRRRALTGSIPVQRGSAPPAGLIPQQSTAYDRRTGAPHIDLT